MLTTVLFFTGPGETFQQSAPVQDGRGKAEEGVGEAQVHAAGESAKGESAGRGPSAGTSGFVRLVLRSVKWRHCTRLMC